MSFFYKGVAVFINFLLVPLTIDFLDVENYGIWLTISSFVAWFSFFDIGLGNGLRNKLTEVLTKENKILAQGYVSSAYFSIALISMILLIIFVILNYFIDWTIVFNTSENLKKPLSQLMPIVFGCFSILLVIKLIGNIYLANQNHSIQVKIHFFTQFLSLVIIYLLLQIAENSLLLFGALFSISPIIVLLVLNYIGFSGKYKFLKPRLSLFKMNYLKDILGLGFEFFIIQISVIILFSTDNFIISKLFSPEEVVPYNIAFKYFSIVSMLFNLIMMPYWSSITEAFVKREYNWIKKSVNSLLKLWLIVPMVLFLMVLISDWFYHIWVGNQVSVPLILSINMAIYVLFFTFSLIFNFFINGVGKIRIQMILSLVSIFLNIPLSIVFSKTIGFGLSGVIMATTISIVASAIIYPIQYSKIINLRAKGIWNR